MNGTLERRAVAELRAAGRRLEGYAATFNTPATIGAFIESIAPGAFRLDGDILALVDHDPGKLLARTKSGTLELEQDGKGLRFGLSVPETHLGQDVLELAKRGDLGGMSFGFHAEAEHWTGSKKRELHRVRLVEISVVSSWPAYSGTTVSVRSRAAPRLALAQRWLETV
ncbi:MAG: HK97 family phage prohead protease [Geminicoccaceae bacterium]